MPVQGVKLAGSFAGESNKVVATGSIRDYGVVVCIDENENRLKIYSFKNAIGGTVHDQDFNNIQNSRLVVDAPLLPLDDGENILMHLIFSLITRAKTISSYTQQIQYIR